MEINILNKSIKINVDLTYHIKYMKHETQG